MNNNNSTIKRKQGDCVYPGCTFHGYLYSRNMCQKHYWKDLKERKRKRATAPVKHIPEQQNKPAGESILFQSIWSTRKGKDGSHRSYLSGRKLDEFESTEFFPNLFAHLLPKAQNKYPDFKLYMKNIILLHPEEHTLLDQGTRELRKKYAEKYNCGWSKVWTLKEELIQEYNDYKEEKNLTEGRKF